VDLGLENKRVVVTGAAGGMGRSVLHILAAEGAKVIAVDRDRRQLEKVAAEISVEPALVVAELRGREGSEAVVAEILDSHGPIDALVHLAAILVPVDVADITEELWDDHMSVNVSATFFLARSIAESMVAVGSGGAILLASSGAWLTGGLPTRLPYAVTKGAVTTLVRGLTKSYGPEGIRVNALAPGLIDTAMMRDGLGEEQRRELEAATPLRRFGRPDEVASVAAFLVSERASFISGATINVSGGQLLY
jgi:NAD(P)-dependent dehydrogenase (short-subunit alcohol dehydrogenase family)